MPAEQILQQKLEESLAKRKRVPTDTRLYIETFIYSLILLFVISAYYGITSPEFSIRTVNRIVADLSFLLIGVSLILSSVCYFWNFADQFIMYRKHLGLVGFGYMLIHGGVSLFYSSYTPFQEYYLSDQRIMSFTAAVLSAGIFMIMAVISNRFSIQKIGPHTWRLIMRIGFIAYALGLYHFAARGWPFWMKWFAGQSSLFPSFGLITFLFGVVVLGMRVALWVATSNKKTT